MQELFSGHGWRVTIEEASLPDGRVKKIARVHHCDSVHILAFDQNNHVLLLREFRPFYKTYIWMLPSGKVDKEDDQDEAAQRELREETGFRARDIVKYCTGNHAEGLVSTNHIYIAHDLVQDPLPQDANELIEVYALPMDEAIEKVLSSPVAHNASAYALLRYAREHGL